MNIRKTIATAVIAGSMSLGAAGLAGAGTASALPPYNPCGGQLYVCNYHPPLNIGAKGTFRPWTEKYLHLYAR